MKKRGHSFNTNKKVSKSEKFFKALVEFYQETLSGAVTSIRQLAEIQKSFPEQYELFKKLNREPDLLLKLSKELTDKEKAIFYEIFVKAASLSERTKILNELTYKEKIILAKDLDDFSKDLVRKIETIKKNHG
jgi:hypothetical protein